MRASGTNETHSRLGQCLATVGGRPPVAYHIHATTTTNTTATNKHCEVNNAAYTIDNTDSTWNVPISLSLYSTVIACLSVSCVM